MVNFLPCLLDFLNKEEYKTIRTSRFIYSFHTYFAHLEFSLLSETNFLIKQRPRFKKKTRGLYQITEYKIGFKTLYFIKLYLYCEETKILRGNNNLYEGFVE